MRTKNSGVGPLRQWEKKKELGPLVSLSAGKLLGVNRFLRGGGELGWLLGLLGQICWVVLFFSV